jgi:hypothetical protein
MRSSSAEAGSSLISYPEHFNQHPKAVYLYSAGRDLRV